MAGTSRSPSSSPLRGTRHSWPHSDPGSPEPGGSRQHSACPTIDQRCVHGIVAIRRPRRCGTDRTSPLMLESMAIAVLIGSALVVVSVFTSLISFRFGAPLLLIFLGVGCSPARTDSAGSSSITGRAAFFVGSWRSRSSCSIPALRRAARRCASPPPRRWRLATAGVLLTAVLVAVAARAALRLPLAGRPAPRRHRRADRRRRGLLPAPGRRHHAPRPGPLDARGRIRDQRPGRDLPDHRAGRVCGRRRARGAAIDLAWQHFGLQIVVGGLSASSAACHRRRSCNRADFEAGALPDHRPRAGARHLRRSPACSTAAASSRSSSPA